MSESATAVAPARREGRLRLAIAGLGLIGKRHAQAIVGVPQISLGAVADPSQAAREWCAAREIACYATIGQLLEAERPDGMILATPTPLHAEQGLECVAANCPVLVEKPLAVTASEALALVEAAQRRGVPLLVGHHRRYNPLIARAFAMIVAGRIGDIRAVQAGCWLYKPDAYFDEAPWRKARGAGPISVNLVHDVDLLRHLCGEIVSVQALASPSARGFENEDAAAALLRFANGAIGTITVSDSIVAPWSWEMTAAENPAYPATSQSAYRIGGSHGSLSIPDLTLWTHEGERDWWRPICATSVPRENSDPLVNQIAHFAEVIEGKATPLVSGREGLRTLRVIEAIQRSAATGETIRIEAE